MNKNIINSSNILFLGKMYIFIAVVLIITIITGAYKTDFMKISIISNIVSISELYIRIIIIILFLIMGVGLLKIKRWAFRLVILYCMYSISEAIIASIIYNNHMLYSNVIFSLFVLYSLYKEKGIFN